MKQTVKQQKQLISDDDIKQAFLNRNDIAKLSPAEQEKQWQEHLVALNEFRKFLSGCDSFVI